MVEKSLREPKTIVSFKTHFAFNSRVLIDLIDLSRSSDQINLETFEKQKKNQK